MKQEHLGTNICVLDGLPQESFPEVGLPGQRAGSQRPVPSGTEDAVGHLPLRVLVISTEVDAGRAGPRAGQASPRSPWVTAEETGLGGESAAWWAQEKAGTGVWGCCHRGTVLSVGLEVTQDWVTVAGGRVPPPPLNSCPAST